MTALAAVLSCGAGLPTARSWIVWEHDGARARVAHSATHLRSAAYEETYLPFFDSYAQARWIWSVALNLPRPRHPIYTRH